MDFNFYRAVQSSHIYKIREYAQNGFDINSDNYLFHSAKTNIEVGANPDLTDHQGNTALMTCAIQGVADSIKMLLDNKADYNIKNIDDQNAVMLSAQSGRNEGFKLLLDVTDNLLEVSSSGESIVTILCSINNIEGMMIFTHRGLQENILEDVLKQVEAIKANVYTENFKSIINSLLLKDKLEITLGNNKKVKTKKI